MLATEPAGETAPCGELQTFELCEHAGREQLRHRAVAQSARHHSVTAVGAGVRSAGGSAGMWAPCTPAPGAVDGVEQVTDQRVGRDGVGHRFDS